MAGEAAKESSCKKENFAVPTKMDDLGIQLGFLVLEVISKMYTNHLFFLSTNDNLLKTQIFSILKLTKFLFQQFLMKLIRRNSWNQFIFYNTQSNHHSK